MESGRQGQAYSLHGFYARILYKTQHIVSIIHTHTHTFTQEDKQELYVGIVVSVSILEQRRLTQSEKTIY